MAWGEWRKGLLYHPLCVCKDGAFAPKRTGTTVNLYVWNHFGLGLVFDTTAITGLGADQGFLWADDGNGTTVTVTSTAIGATSGGRTAMSCILSAVPTGTNPKLNIAMTGASGAASGPATGNRSTLRTTGSGVFTRSGREVNHFVCIDQIPVL